MKRKKSERVEWKKKTTYILKTIVLILFCVYQCHPILLPLASPARTVTKKISFQTKSISEYKHHSFARAQKDRTGERSLVFLFLRNPLGMCASARANQQIYCFVFVFHSSQFLTPPSLWGWVVFFLHIDVCLLKCRRGDDTRCAVALSLARIKWTLNIGCGCGPLFLYSRATHHWKDRHDACVYYELVFIPCHASQMMRKTEAGGAAAAAASPREKCGNIWMYLRTYEFAGAILTLTRIYANM